jgi:uncharacterized protein
MIEVKIDAIRISMMNTRVVILKELNGQRALPIYIGEPEANSISIQLQGMQVVRPITHDLIVSMIREMGAQIRHVVVHDMQETMYFARIIIANRDGKELRIDSRPSDAIAIAVRMDVPIYVEDEIMDKYGQAPDEEMATPGADEDLGAFKDFLGSLDLDDLDKK